MAKNTDAKFAPGVVWAGKKAKEEAKKLVEELKKKKAIQKELTGGKGNKPSFKEPIDKESFRSPIILEPREEGVEGRGAVKSRFRPPIQKGGEEEIIIAEPSAKERMLQELEESQRNPRIGKFQDLSYKKGGSVKSKKSVGTSVKTYSSGGYVEGK